MSKKLSFEGSIRSGVRWGIEGGFRQSGNLPENPDLDNKLQKWKEHFLEYAKYHFKEFRIDFPYTGEIIVRDEDSWQEAFNACQQTIKALDSWLLELKFWETIPQNSIVFLALDPSNALAELPWQESSLGKFCDLRLTPLNYPSLPNTISNLSLPRALGVLGTGERLDMAGDRSILESSFDSVRILESPPFPDLCDALWEDNFEVLYFGGHGEEVGFCVSEGESIAIKEDLVAALEQAIVRGLKLVFLNFCNSHQSVPLSSTSVPVVVCWSAPVPDAIARSFATFFFHGLSGNNYASAFQYARRRLDEKWKKSLPKIGCFLQLWQHPEFEQQDKNAALSIPRLISKRRTVARGLGLAGILVGFRKIISYKTVILLAGIFAASYPLGFLVNQIGLYFAHRGNINLARAFYKASDIIDRNTGDTYFNLAISAEKDNDTSKAIELYNKAAKEGEINAYPSLARLQLVTRQYQEAIQTGTLCVNIALLKNISEEWRSDLLIICYARIAWGYWKSENLLLAESSIEKGLKYNGDDNSLFDLHCVAFGVRRDMGKDAREWAEKLLKIKDNVSDLKAIKPDCITAASSYLSSRMDVQ
ncbi:MAG: tetratricopeptide repeat protein [Cyanobacteria bacterium SBLK]|nr:tetratricopeptide repeat protein [Cyanobacteria bacterium SBLK]